MSKNMNLCTSPDVDSCISADIGRSPAILSAGISIQFPATKATVQIFQSGQFNVFASNIQSTLAGLPNSFSSPDIQSTSTVTCAVLLRGVGVRVTVGARSYGTAGVAVPTPSGSSDVPALSQMPDGSSANRPATMAYNQHAWDAAKEFMEAFVLYAKLGCDYILINERVADLGYLGATNSYCGLGLASTPIHSDIAEVNNYANDVLSSPWQFLPLNAAGSCCPGGVLIPLPEPLAEVQWGGPCFEGKYGGVFPIPMCLVLCPGMPLQFYLQTLPGTSYWFNKFIQDISDEGEVTCGKLWSNKLVSTTTSITAVTGATVVVAGVTTVVPAGDELPPESYVVTGTTAVVAVNASITIAGGGTLAPGAAIVAPSFSAPTTTTTQIGWSSSVVFKGGIMNIEIALIGYELDVDSCLEFFGTFGPGMVGNVRELYMTHASSYLMGAMMQSPKYRAMGTAGVAGLFEERAE